MKGKLENQRGLVRSYISFRPYRPDDAIPDGLPIFGKIGSTIDCEHPGTGEELGGRRWCSRGRFKSEAGTQRLR